MSSEEKEHALIRRVYSGAYAHAENLLLRLMHLEVHHGKDRAIDLLHREVIDRRDATHD